MKTLPPPVPLKLFLTVEHPCGYLTGRQARNLIVDPEVVDQALYNRLSKLGFRRSGGFIYRPECSGCRACRSLRISVPQFTPDRSQRRTWQRNEDLTVTRRRPAYSDEHFRLFASYLARRHRGGGMDETSPEQFMGFVRSIWSDSWFYEFRHARRLVAVAVVDQLDDGLSAVYSYFDPREKRRGLGTYAILWQIQEAERLGLTWAYLGFWVHGAPRMEYKTRFRPSQVFRQNRWHWLAPSTDTEQEHPAAGIVRSA